MIDAASACEVALSDSLRASLPTSLRPEGVQQMIDRRKGGLMELYDFRVAAAGPVRGVSWGRLSGELAGPRNDVAHAGHRPEREQVNLAIDVAAALLAEVAPLRPR